MQCSIPISTLTNSLTFNLSVGVSVNVQIIAINAYGFSTVSVVGTGAVIVYSPDAPINLVENTLVTLQNQIGLSWQAGLSNGGSPIIDYQVWYDCGNQSSLTLVAANITTTSYTVTGLIAGHTYVFVVRSRNSVMFSSYSLSVSILAA